MDFEEILKRLNELPCGYISKKHINGKTYFYLQQRKDKRILSKYIAKENLAEIRKQLALREKYERVLEKFKNEGNELKQNLSKREKELTGYVMSGNQVVAKVVNDEIVYKDSKRCPLILTKSKYLSSFLRKRVIDESRINSRLLKRTLNIINIDTDRIPLYVNAAMITDNFWFRPPGSKLIYDDVKFKFDTYSDLSLKGDTRFVGDKPKVNPQLTLIGSFEKCWKLINGEWWLYKVGNENEIFSEIFCSRLASSIGINTAIYEQDGKYIRTKNFADVYNFEPMSSLAREDDSYENVFNVLFEMDSSFASRYLELMYFDALVENVDRHNENLGFLRNKITGRIVSLAPNFDNNIALISRFNVLNEDRSKSGVALAFSKFLRTNENAYKLFKKLELVPINDEILDKCFESLSFKGDKQNIKNFIINSYKLLSIL